KTLSPDALRAMLPTADPVTRGRIAWELGNRAPSELRPSAPPPLELAAPESVAEQTARLEAEAKAKQTAAELQAEQDRAQFGWEQKLSGSTGDLGQADMLDPTKGDLFSQAEQDKQIHDEENQVPFGFGPGGASIEENLNIESQIKQLNATVSNALRTPRNLSPRAAFTKAYQAVGKQFVTGKQSLQRGLNNVRTSWQAMKHVLMRSPLVDDFINAVKDWHFADNKTSFEVRQFVRNVRANIRN